MEISLTNVRDIGFKKIGKYYVSDKLVSDISSIYKELLTVKLPVYSFLKYWDAIDYCSSSVNGLKNWVQAFEPILSADSIDEPTKRRFRQRYTTLFDKFGTSAGLDAFLMMMLKDIAVKVELLVAINDDLSLYGDILNKVYKYVDTEKIADTLGGTKIHELINALFEWGCVTQTELFNDKSASVMELIVALCELDRNEFVVKLLEGDLWV